MIYKETERGGMAEEIGGVSGRKTRKKWREGKDKQSLREASEKGKQQENHFFLEMHTRGWGKEAKTEKGHCLGRGVKDTGKDSHKITTGASLSYHSLSCSR